MKKKLIGCAFAALALAMNVATVSALGSINVNGAVVDGSIYVNGELVEGSKGLFSETFDDSVKEDTMTVINSLNKGTSLEEAFADVEMTGVEINLADYALLTEVQDLKCFDAEGNTLEENVTVSWEVPNLTTEDVKVIHYSTVREVWEVIEPDAVNTADKEVTATFEDLSPVAVIYDTTTTGTGEVGTSTSTNSNLYIGLAAGAVIVAGVCFVIARKRHA